MQDLFDEYQKEVDKKKKKTDRKKKDKKEKEEKPSDRDKDRKVKKSKERRERSRSPSSSRSRSSSEGRGRGRRDKQRESDRKQWEREQAARRQEESAKQDKVVNELLRNLCIDPPKKGEASVSVDPVPAAAPAPAPAPVPSPTGTPVKGVNNVHLKVAMEGNDNAKMIIIPRDVSYDILMHEVMKKWSLDESATWVVSFEDEDGDKIEIDDADSLDMYISGIDTGKRGKVFVTRVEESKNAMDADPEDNINECPNPPAKEDANTSSTKKVQTAVSKKRDDDDDDSVAEDDPNLAMYKQPFPKPNCVRKYAGHDKVAFYCCFRKKGKQFATSSKDGSIRLWDVEESKPTKVKQNAYNGSVLSCDYSEDGSLLVSTSNDKEKSFGMKLHNGLTLKRKGILKGHTQKVYCAKFVGSGASRVASASCDKTVKLWDVEKEKVITKMQGHSANIFTLAVSSCGSKLATGGDDKKVKIWSLDGKSSGCIGTLSASSIVWAVAFSEDGSRLVTGTMKPKEEEPSYATLSVYDLNNLKLMKSIKVADSIQHVEFIQNDSILASCGRDKAMSFFDGEDFSLRYHHTLDSKIYHASFHGDRFLTSSMTGEVALWDLPDFSKSS